MTNLIYQVQRKVSDTVWACARDSEGYPYDDASSLALGQLYLEHARSKDPRPTFRLASREATPWTSVDE